MKKRTGCENTKGSHVLQHPVSAFLRPEEPQTAAEFHAHGRAALRDGKPEIARADFISAHERSADPQDLALAAYCYSLTGDHRTAIEWYKKAIAAGTDTAEIRNNHGASLMRVGLPDEAVKELDVALALSKDFRSAKYNRAVARYMLALKPDGKDQLPLAITDMDEVVKVGPCSSELHVDAARIYALGSAGNPALCDRSLEQLGLALKLGHPPANLQMDMAFKLHLGKDPRFAAIVKAEAQPAIPPVQLHFVEPPQ